MTVPPVGNQLRVLVVDDRRDITLILEKLLERVGHAVKTAGDGVSALGLARSFGPHVIISDLGLAGEMSGAAFAQAVRSDSSIRAPHLIAVTGHDDSEHRQQAADAGFHHYMVKPANIQELLAILSGVDSSW